MTPLLDVRGLSVEFPTSRGTLRALDQVSFSVRHGETLGLVGESGSGKSVACRAVIRLLPASARISGEVCFDGQDLQRLDRRRLRTVRGSQIAMIQQDPLASLNPAFTVGDQVAEALALHQRLRGRRLHEATVDMLRKVGIPAPERRMRDFPHQLSGGMRQRVVGAIALSCQPRLLLADEPTTSLDPTIQLQFLRLLRDLQREFGFAMVFITHDLGIVSRVCDRVAVMYAGRVVETAPTQVLFAAPRHPYTEALLATRAIVRAGQNGSRRSARLPVIPGTVPVPIGLPPGCAFAPRCGYTMPACRTQDPHETVVGPAADHTVRCWRYGDDG